MPLVPPASAATFTTTARDNFWTVTSLAIAPGDSVQFLKSAVNPHTVRIASGPIRGLPWTETFPTAGVYGFVCTVHPLTMTGTITVGTPATVTITSPASGASVSGVVTVTGTVAPGDTTVARVEIRLDNAVTWIPATLDGTSWSYALDTTQDLANGAHTIKARAVSTAGSLSSEAAVSVVFANPTTFDLTVASASGNTGQSTTATVTYTIRNDGNTATSTVRVRLEYFYQGEWRFANEVNEGSVPAFTTTGPRAMAWTSNTGTAEGRGTFVGRFDVRVTVDATGVVAETDETDNVRGATAAFVTNGIAGIDLRDPI